MSKEFTWLATAILGSALAAPLAAPAASFDCRKATSPVELQICSNDELSKLDDQLLESYRGALKVLEDTTELKSEQRLWLVNERNKCGDSYCLISAYRSRISHLNNIGYSKGFILKYLGGGKVQLSHGSLKGEFDLSNDIHGCQDDLYDPATEETTKYVPEIDVVAMAEKQGITTLMFLVSSFPNCNIQGWCGAGTNTDLIALGVDNELKQSFIHTFWLDDCFSGRVSKYMRQFDAYFGGPVSERLRKMKRKIRVEFENPDDTDESSFVVFDMQEPSKGFVVESAPDTPSTK